MTDVEKQKIQELRVKGDGYKAIAAVLSISRDTIRGYCKRNGLDGDLTLISLKEKQNQNSICACCNKVIKQKEHGRRRFCSEDCRRKWWNENQDRRNKKEAATYKYICPNCGKEFSSYGNKNRKYCSHDCYIKSRFGEVGEVIAQ